MNKIYSNKKLVGFIFLAIAVALLGTRIALVIYKLEALDTVIKGNLSATILTFIYLLFMSPSSPYMSKGGGLKIEIPGDLKHFVLYFFLSIIIYWSLRYVYNAVLFLINIRW